jgi:hypothetical protein
MQNKKTLASALLCAVFLGIIAIYFLPRALERLAAPARRGNVDATVADLLANAGTLAANARATHTREQVSVNPEGDAAQPDAPASRAADNANSDAENGPTPAGKGIDIPSALADKGYLIALFDVNDDSRPDLVAYARDEAKIVQVLLAKEDGEFEDSPDAKVPEYLTSFLALTAEGESPEGPVLLHDENGKEHELMFVSGDGRP